MWYVTLIDFHMLNYLCIPGVNSTCSWYDLGMILLMCCWIQIVRISLRIFAPIVIRDTGL